MGKVIMTITCDWEGRTLVPADLMALRQLNIYLESAGSILSQVLPITHFICPAYFTRNYVEGDRMAEAEKIKKSGAIKATDEVALHVHCWKSLALEAGIPSNDFQLGPLGSAPFQPANFIRKDPDGGADIIEPDLGETVVLGIYNQAQIELYLGIAMTLVKKYLAVDTVSYRSGQWVTCDSVFSALASTPLKYEASALPFNLAATMYAHFNQPPYSVALPVFQWNSKIWGNAQTTGADPIYEQNTQSFAQYGTGILGAMDTQISQPKAIGTCIEIPDTGALIPSTNNALMNSYIDTAFQLAGQSNTTIYISIGFHQENASKPAFFATQQFPLTQGEKLARINGIQDSVIHAITEAKRTGTPLEFLTIQQAGIGLGT